MAQKIGNQNMTPKKDHSNVDASKPARETLKPLNHKTTVHSPAVVAKAKAALGQAGAPVNPSEYQ